MNNDRIMTVAVITVSDKGYAGTRQDLSGPALCERFVEEGWVVIHTAIVPDEIDMIKAELIKSCDELKADLIVTTGGTGFSQRDITPEATKAVCERDIPGIPEAMRAESMRITPKGCLSRGTAGLRGQAFIVNCPGSRKAAIECINAVMPALKHGVIMAQTFGSADCAEQ